MHILWRHTLMIIYKSFKYSLICSLFLYVCFLITLTLKNSRVHPRQLLAPHIFLIHHEVHKRFQHKYLLQVVIRIDSQ